ncbi:MAG: A/G-specific adenine glycosylase [Gammaproteobacteria bacterium]|nr:A/G-specific adenine glycosylase [Gammaproteobacteria bacterium]
MTDFSGRLLAWFDEHGRKDLPWQEDTTPYRVWVSEIMLQQTQVQTVVPYFERFMIRFPDVAALAAAGQDAVLQHWSGLGYYARARNMHKAAQIIRSEFGGEFPTRFEDVVSLPGVGRSTAGAILSIACGQRHAILDGNVKRVLARHGAVEGWPGKSDVAAILWDMAETNTPDERGADYTQAIMDLGATLCTRSKPDCDRCPVAADCEARLADATADYPERKPRQVKPLRKTTMILASAAGKVYLVRRPEAGIWGGLWSLPELGDTSVDDWCADKLASIRPNTRAWEVLRHSFSHYDLDILPIVVQLESAPSKVADTSNETWHSLQDELPGGIAAPVQRLIDQLKSTLDVTHY